MLRFRERWTVAVQAGGAPQRDWLAEWRAVVADPHVWDPYDSRVASVASGVNTRSIGWHETEAEQVARAGVLLAGRCSRCSGTCKFRHLLTHMLRFGAEVLYIGWLYFHCDFLCLALTVLCPQAHTSLRNNASGQGANRQRQSWLVSSSYDATWRLCHIRSSAVRCEGPADPLYAPPVLHPPPFAARACLIALVV